MSFETDFTAILGNMDTSPGSSTVEIPSQSNRDGQSVIPIPSTDNDNNNNNPQLDQEAAFAKLISELRKANKPIEDLQPTRTELAIAMMAKKFGMDTAKLILDKFHDAATFYTTLTLLHQMFQGVGNITTYRENIVTSLTGYDDATIVTVNSSYIARHVPITPFNFFHELMSCPFVVAMPETEGNQVTFAVTGKEFKVTISDIEKAYAESTLIFREVEKKTLGLLYDIQIYNEEYYRLSIFLSRHCNLVKKDDKWSLVALDSIPPPPSGVIGKYEGMELVIAYLAGEFAKLPMDFPLTEMTGGKLPIIYCNVVRNFAHIAPPVISAWRLHLRRGFSPETQRLLQVTHRNSFTPDALRQGVLKMRNTDEFMDDLKSLLDIKRNWRDMDQATDRITHDLMMSHGSVHLGHKKWGGLSRGLLMQAIKKFTGVDLSTITQANLFGPGCDNFASQIRKDKRVHLTGLNPDIPIVMKGQDKQILRVDVDNTRIDHIAKVESNSLTMSFANITDAKDFQRALEEWVNKIGDSTNLVLTMDHNYCDLQSFNTIMEYCQDQGIGFWIYKHPRLHNDAYTWIFSPGRFNINQFNLAYAERFVMANMIIDNNRVRDTIIYTGWYPFNKTAAPEYFVKAFALMLVSQSGSKSLSKKEKRIQGDLKPETIQALDQGMEELDVMPSMEDDVPVPPRTSPRAPHPDNNNNINRDTTMVAREPSQQEILADIQRRANVVNTTPGTPEPMASETPLTRSKKKLGPKETKLSRK